jgi:hypothetical protein
VIPVGPPVVLRPATATSAQVSCPSPKKKSGMSTYIAQSRSNYFKVKDEELFQKFCDQYELEILAPDAKSADRQFGFLFYGSLPMDRTDDNDNWIEADLVQELSQQLAPGVDPRRTPPPADGRGSAPAGISVRTADRAASRRDRGPSLGRRLPRCAQTVSQGPRRDHQEPP